MGLPTSYGDDVSSSAFLDYHLPDVKVPVGYLDTYKSSYDWSYFDKITEE